MTAAAYTAHPALALAAEVAPYALGLLCAALPLAAWGKKRMPCSPALLWLCGCLSLALIYALRCANRKFGIGVAAGLHFSTHTAVALSFAVTLLAFDLRLAPALAAVLGSYLWIIVFLGYHATHDVWSTLVVMLPLCLLCHLPWWRKIAAGKR